MLDDSTVRLALPKGRMQEGVLRLLEDAGINVNSSSRGYRPKISLDNTEVKMLKPQNIVEMLTLGTRDVGFAGADWVAELGVDVVDLLDTEMDPVRIVAAAPEALLNADGDLPEHRLVVASEYERLTRDWIAARGLDAAFVRSYGATEVFPPEDADLIVDNTATGSTLAANRLKIVEDLLYSSTHLYASRKAMDDPNRRDRIEGIVLLLQSVMEARKRVMVEVNVSADQLEAVVKALPSMRQPTLSPLRGGEGYAVKAAVPLSQLPQVILEVKRRGGTDLVVTKPRQIVP